MFARRVEAHLLEHLDIVAQGRVGGSGQAAVGPVSLVQHPAQEELLAVKINPGTLAVGLDGDLAHPEIALNCVQGLAIAPQLQLQVIEVGVLRRPQLRRGNLQHQPRVGAPAILLVQGDKHRIRPRRSLRLALESGRRLLAAEGEAPMRDDRPTIHGRDVQRRAQGFRGGHHRQLQPAPFHVGTHHQFFDPLRRRRLQPDGLPRPGRGGVEPAVGNADLFTARLVTLLGRVEDIKQHFLPA